MVQPGGAITQLYREKAPGKPVTHTVELHVVAQFWQDFDNSRIGPRRKTRARDIINAPPEHATTVSLTAPSARWPPVRPAAARLLPGASGASATRPPPSTPGAPPTFGTGPVSGPPVSAATFAEAEKLAQVTMRPADRELAAASWRRSLAPLLERRTGPRKVALEPDVAPATRLDPVAHRHASRARARPLRPQPRQRSHAAAGQRCRRSPSRRSPSSRAGSSEADHLRPPDAHLSAAHRALDPKLRVGHHQDRGPRAGAGAKQADAEIAAGRYRGPLHGIPYGVKDLLDTAGIATTYGAEPFRDARARDRLAVVAQARPTPARCSSPS